MNPNGSLHLCSRREVAPPRALRRGVGLRATGMLLACAAAGCLAPVTATYKDVTIPVMVGGGRVKAAPPSLAKPIEAELVNSTLWFPLAFGMSTYHTVHEPIVNEASLQGLELALLASGAQCTACVAHIERIRVGSYTTSLPVDILFSYTKHWSGIEGTVGERPAAPASTPPRTY